jgi:hypothetical protein
VTNRVIFLDIDGPMIPSYCYIMYGAGASFDRKMSPVAVSMINWLCEQTEAKIVCKSMHNYLKSNHGDDLQVDLIANGVLAHNFHEDWRTKFGNITDHTRYTSIHEWLSRHPEVDQWVDFDDEQHTKNERLILVNFDDGINMKHINAALEIFEVTPLYFF